MNGFFRPEARSAGLRIKWVYHAFYPFQFDLNYANPRVVREVYRIFAFWANRGIDVFRLDAMPSELMSQDGMPILCGGDEAAAPNNPGFVDSEEAARTAYCRQAGIKALGTRDTRDLGRGPVSPKRLEDAESGRGHPLASRPFRDLFTGCEVVPETRGVMAVFQLPFWKEFEDRQTQLREPASRSGRPRLQACSGEGEGGSAGQGTQVIVRWFSGTRSRKLRRHWGSTMRSARSRSFSCAAPMNASASP